MTATKKVTKRVTKKAVKDDGVYWVLSQRTKLFFWEPVEVYKSRDAAVERRDALENTAPYSYNSYKVSRVVLLG